MARHDNVYDAMLAGFMKLILVICIGALTLGKFAGFEWLRIQPQHLEPLMGIKSPRMVLEFFVDSATESKLWLAGLVWVYLLMGVLRMPGQMLMHILAGFGLGFKIGFPTVLVANTVTSCTLYYLGSLYAAGGSTDAWEYYAQKIDVFLLKIAQANFGCYVDPDGQRLDKAKQAEIKADPSYAAKHGRDKAKAEEDNWDEWKSWNNERFMYLLWLRVLPFTEHWLMNMGGGLVDGKGMIFKEFFLATFLGNIPYIMFITKVGELMKFYYIEEMLAWEWVKWPVISFLALLPPMIQHSGILEKQMGKGEYGWNRTPGKQAVDYDDEKDE